MMKLMAMLQIEFHKKKFTINISSFLGANIENHEPTACIIKLITSA